MIVKILKKGLGVIKAMSKHVLHLGLSYNCNMHCSHCFVNKKKDLLNLEKYCNIIDDLNNRGLFMVFYTFGEPLMSKYFFELCDYVKQKNIVQVLMSNGSLITEDIVKNLKNVGINTVCISLDSANKLKHDNNRRFKNSFDLAINSIKLLVDNKINVGIATTINDSNIQEINSIIKLGQTLKVNFISFLRERKDGKLFDFINNKIYLNNIKSIITDSQLELNIQFHDPLTLKLINELYNNNQIDDVLYEKYYEMNLCHSDTTLSIEPDGTVTNCNLCKCYLGNILHESISEIIERENKNENFICSSPLSK